MGSGGRCTVISFFLSAPALPKAEAKAKAWRPRKQRWKASTAIKWKKKIHTLLIFQWPKTLWLRREPKYPQKSAPGRNIGHYAIKSPQPASQPRRRQKTQHSWCSLWMSRPTRTRVNRLWRRPVTSTWPRPTPSSGLREGRRHMSNWLLTMMLRMLPIKLGSSKLSAAG